ncbi:MAG: redoxin domain-containing protein [Dehalococcoidia bacterium]|nr:redoxin domain-containing protein [Dehalococcoidia bacterium]
MRSQVVGTMSWPLFVLVCTLACGTDAPTVVPTVMQTSTPTAIPTAVPSPTVSSESSVDTESDEAPGPEFAGISGWINSEPLRMADLRGKVVLIDFWTYTCINCIRTFPHLKEWHAKYADKGLVVVGVHSPEFLFETVRSNVEQAVVDFGIEYPVAQDNLLNTWRAFGNRSWPGKFLVDKDGAIRFRHFGEGQYAKTEKRIRELLTETGVSLAGIPANSKADGPVYPGLQSSSSIEEEVTRELFASSIKNRIAFTNGGQKLAYIGNDEYFLDSSDVTTYIDPGDHRNHYLYLHGLWEKGRESIIHASETTGYEDYIAIKFYSNDVNVVLGMKDLEYEVHVTIGDRPLARSQAGDDIRYDAEGNSYLVVDQARMFNIVRLDEFGTHELKISSNSDDFELFTFSFGHYQRTPRELAGITEWINTVPLALDDLRGKVVLVVFFSVACDDCIQVQPFIESWKRKYGSHGLTVIGIHIPQFEFEKRPDIVTGSLEAQGVMHAVGVDQDGASARAFRNRSLPGMHLMDKDGFIRHVRLGPGGYTLMEQEIRHWLEDTGADLSGVAFMTQKELEPDPRTFALEDEIRRTRDIFLGSLHNDPEAPDPFFRQPEYPSQPDEPFAYRDPGEYENHYVYLQGLWQSDEESIVHARETAEYEDYLAFKMVGKKVAAILSNGDGTVQRVLITMDGLPVPSELAGEDVMYDTHGESYVTVDRPRVYQLIDLPEYASHDLKLWSKSTGLEVYTITFEANIFEPQPF